MPWISTLHSWGKRQRCKASHSAPEELSKEIHNLEASSGWKCWGDSIYLWKNHIQWKVAKLKGKTGSGYKPLDTIEGILGHMTAIQPTTFSDQVSLYSVHTHSITFVFRHNIPNSQVLLIWSSFRSYPTCTVQNEIKTNTTSFKACFRQCLFWTYRMSEFCIS